MTTERNGMTATITTTAIGVRRLAGNIGAEITGADTGGRAEPSAVSSALSLALPLPMITLLRNASLNSLKYRTELALVKAQNIDITQFENQLETFKTGFAKNYDLASRNFQTAITEIDKSIDHLQKTNCLNN